MRTLEIQNIEYEKLTTRLVTSSLVVALLVLYFSNYKADTTFVLTSGYFIFVTLFILFTGLVPVKKNIISYNETDLIVEQEDLTIQRYKLNDIISIKVVPAAFYLVLELKFSDSRQRFMVHDYHKSKKDLISFYEEIKPMLNKVSPIKNRSENKRLFFMLILLLLLIGVIAFTAIRGNLRVSTLLIAIGVFIPLLLQVFNNLKK